MYLMGKVDPRPTDMKFKVKICSVAMLPLTIVWAWFNNDKNFSILLNELFSEWFKCLDSTVEPR